VLFDHDHVSEVGVVLASTKGTVRVRVKLPPSNPQLEHVLVVVIMGIWGAVVEMKSTGWTQEQRVRVVVIV
jgi:hypothetical protein